MAMRNGCIDFFFPQILKEVTFARERSPYPQRWAVWGLRGGRENPGCDTRAPRQPGLWHPCSRQPGLWHSRSPPARAVTPALPPAQAVPAQQLQGTQHPQRCLLRSPATPRSGRASQWRVRIHTVGNVGFHFPASPDHSHMHWPMSLCDTGGRSSSQREDTQHSPPRCRDISLLSLSRPLALGHPLVCIRRPGCEPPQLCGTDSSLALFPLLCSARAWRQEIALWKLE